MWYKNKTTMKTSIPNYIIIQRLDYKNPSPQGGFFMLPSLHSLDEISDINEVKSITIGHFYSKEERDNLAAKFPKSYKPRLSTGYDFDETNKTDFDNPYYCVFFDFNTFFNNKVTGDKNESAFGRRNKIIKKIRELL